MDRNDVGQRLLDRVLAGIPADESPLRHLQHFPERRAEHADWPAWAPESLIGTLREHGTHALWTHQAEGAEAAWAGNDVVIATGTSSGKSMVYQLPVLARLLTDETATALYLAPTKALGQDQVRAVEDLGLETVRAATYNGDTPRAERDWARAHGRWIFTNPDMLHHGVLSQHSRWARFFRQLNYVVIDECHTYRGVFGSHVALLMRRLRRIARHHGADPVFVLASATVADPAALGQRLIGTECRAVTEDRSPRGARTVALWEPPLLEGITGENEAPIRRSAGSETARIMTELVIENARTLAFLRSRRGVETASLATRRALSDVAPELADKVAAYRGGYLPEERRALEENLVSGELTALATTNALELGVDISGLDAVIVAGYPGTLASFWQQAGRAGRGEESALILFVAREDPLDTYLVHHPPAVLDRPVEATVLDPENPYVLEPHLACAASELPLTEESFEVFGGQSVRETVEALATDGVLRRRPRGWYWNSHDRPHHNVPLRGTGGQQVVVVEGDSGRMLGTVDPDAACATVHPGAVYLHQGESFVVDELDLDEAIAFVHAENPEWTTSPRSTVDISVLRVVEQHRPNADVSFALGEVEVTSQVVGYLRKLPSGEVVDQVELDLPAQKLVTRAVWYTLSERLLGSGPNSNGADSNPGSADSNPGGAAPNSSHAEANSGDAGPNGGDAGPSGSDAGPNRASGSAPGGAGLDSARIPGALHAAEHAAIGLLPLFATCDRWDIGGVSTAMHEDTGEATVFVHDGHPGGAGFADRGFAALVPWLAATREAIVSCECPAGCPSCVQSPKCGNGNEPLDKAGAVAVLDAVSAARAQDP